MIPTENKKLLNPEFAHIARQYEIMKSGYGAVNNDGVIVDRRDFPELPSLKRNDVFNIPEPKLLQSDDRQTKPVITFKRINRNSRDYTSKEEI